MQKVFEMRAAGEDLTKIGNFFHHFRQWATNIVKNIFKEIIKPEYCKKLYGAMLKRLDLVIKNKGFRIKY